MKRLSAPVGPERYERWASIRECAPGSDQRSPRGTSASGGKPLTTKAR